jgi:hypothetical protein
MQEQPARHFRVYRSSLDGAWLDFRQLVRARPADQLLPRCGARCLSQRYRRPIDIDAKERGCCGNPVIDQTAHRRFMPRRPATVSSFYRHSIDLLGEKTMSEGDRSAAGLWRQPPVRLNWWSAGGVSHHPAAPVPRPTMALSGISKRVSSRFCDVKNAV